MKFYTFLFIFLALASQARAQLQSTSVQDISSKSRDATREGFLRWAVSIGIVDGQGSLTFDPPTDMGELKFSHDAGFKALRNLFASKLGVRPQSIRILAASGSYIDSEEDFHQYVIWCKEQETPLKFLVKIVQN